MIDHARLQKIVNGLDPHAQQILKTNFPELAAAPDPEPLPGDWELRARFPDLFDKAEAAAPEEMDPVGEFFAGRVPPVRKAASDFPSPSTAADRADVEAYRKLLDAEWAEAKELAKAL